MNLITKNNRKTNNKTHCKTKQKGSALAIAVFVIMVMSLLGGALVKMLNSSAEAVAYEVMGARAYAAAQTGVQWQLSELFPLNVSSISDCKSDAVIESSKPNISNAPGLNSCIIVDISCTSSDFDGVRYYVVSSTGQCDASGVLTSRFIEIEARSLP